MKIIKISDTLERLDRSHVNAGMPLYMNPQEISLFIPEKGKATKEERLVALCHELGHIVGMVVETPGAINDARFQGQYFYGPFPESVLRSEEEAWEIAEKIFQNMKQYALSVYKENSTRSSVPLTQNPVRDII